MSVSEEAKKAAIMAADQVFRWFARAVRWVIDKYGEEALKGLEEEFRKIAGALSSRVLNLSFDVIRAVFKPNPRPNSSMVLALMKLEVSM